MVRRKKETGLTFSGTSSVTVVRVYFQIKNKKQPNLRVRCVAVRRRIVLRGSRVLVVEVFPVRWPTELHWPGRCERNNVVRQCNGSNTPRDMTSQLRTKHWRWMSKRAANHCIELELQQKPKNKGSTLCLSLSRCLFQSGCHGAIKIDPAQAKLQISAAVSSLTEHCFFFIAVELCQLRSNGRRKKWKYVAVAKNLHWRCCRVGVHARKCVPNRSLLDKCKGRHPKLTWPMILF